MGIGNWEQATFMHGGEIFFMGTASEPPAFCLAASEPPASYHLPCSLLPPTTCLLERESRTIPVGKMAQNRTILNGAIHLPL
ncbi:MAG: hypothetical protein F6K47_34990 [Symploca sp. SIO2E6]|nr:hypothetical protein [Symploca sp. SIO2E6]